MGKRHDTLDYKYFHKTRYINKLEQYYKIKSLKSEYSEMFDFMYDTFKTLILVNNVLFADSNKNNIDKASEITIIIEQYLYGRNENDSEKKKYSVRMINSILEKHCVYIHRKLDEWYETLNCITSKNIESSNYFKSIKNEVNIEMERLEDVMFDYIDNGKVIYEKEKNSNKKKYLSKFSDLKDDKNFIAQYVKDFNNNYGTNFDSDDEQVSEIKFIFDLITSANNGIINTLYNNKSDYFIFNQKTPPQELYKYYLSTLNMEINDNMFSLSSMAFQLKVLSTIKDLPKQFACEFNTLIKNFDLYYFISNIDDISKQDDFEYINSYIEKIVKDLLKAYELIKKDEYSNALIEIENIINRNKNCFESIS